MPNIPSKLDKVFRNISEAEAKETTMFIMADLKKRLPRIDLEDKDLYEALKYLYNSGTIDENELALLETIIQKRGQNKEVSLKFIKDYERSLPSKGTQLIGRQRDMTKLVQNLSDPQVHGIILLGPPGVGKTSLAREVDKEADQQQTTFFIELKGITKMTDLYVCLLCKFDLTYIPRNELERQVNKALPKSYNTSLNDRKIIISHLENITSKTSLILDDIEDELVKNDEHELKEFISSINQSKAVQNGTLKIIITISTEIDLNIPSVKHQCIDPLSDENSHEFLSKGLEDERGKEEEQLRKIATYCRGNPYLLQGAVQMMREGFCNPADVLENIESQIENDVPEKYACIEAMFESISSDELKQLAVNISLLTGPFSVKTAMKIADTSDYYATIDLELLFMHKIIEKVQVEEKEESEEQEKNIKYEVHSEQVVVKEKKKSEEQEKNKYEVHSLFQEFVTSSLIPNVPLYMEVYKRAQQRFALHFLDKMNALVETIDTDFLGTFKKFEKDRVNLDMALNLVSTANEGMMERLLPSKNHEYRLVILLESLKDLKGRRKLFKTWADAFEREEKWLPSANMRCWQSIQLADLEGTIHPERILEHAGTCLKKALEEPASDTVQLKDGKALFWLCCGKMAYMKSANLDKNESKKKQELVKEALRNLDGALAIYRELYGNHSMTVRTLNLKGNCFMEMDDPDQAGRAYKEALEMKKELIGSEKHCEIAMFYSQLSQVHERRGRKEEENEEKWWPLSLIPWGRPRLNIKEEYERAVEFLKKALALDKELHLNNSLGSATSNRNLANVLIGLKRYDEALDYATESYRLRKELLDEHPETVRILYLIGVIHEWRRDFNSALKNFEEAFIMEEFLPQGNHSVVRVKLCDEFKRMCDKCKDKIKLREYTPRIVQLKQLTELPAAPDEPRQRFPDETTLRETPIKDHAETKTSVLPEETTLCRAISIKDHTETKISVDEHGGVYSLERYGILLKVPPEAVSNKNEITIKLLTEDSFPSPARDMEAVVSFIVELGPCDVVLHKPIDVKVMHSGSEGTSYYENIVMAFNKSTRTWEEIQEFHDAQAQDHHPLSNYPTGLIQIQLTKLTTLVVISRLITDTFEVPASGCYVMSSVCPEITLDFPEGTIDRTIKGNLKVLPMPDVIPTDVNVCPSPIVVVGGFENINLSRPVTLTLPHPCPGKYPRSKVHVMYRKNDEWKEITKNTCFMEHESTIELQIKQFSLIWVLIEEATTDILLPTVLYYLYKYSSGVRQKVCFSAYKLKNMDASTGFLKLTLCCMAEHMVIYVNKERFGSEYNILAQATGREMMPQQKTYTKVIGSFEAAEKVELQFSGKGEICEKELNIVKKEITDKQEPKFVITFHSTKTIALLPNESDELCRITVYDVQLEHEDKQPLENSNTTTFPPDSRDVYKMKSSPRGLMVIINMEKFPDNSNLPQRKGSENDVEELRNLFEEHLDFMVQIKRNKGRYELLTELSDISENPENARYDCLAVCIMSHGKEKVVYAADGHTINIDQEVVTMFTNTRCYIFRNKPKLFFIQACRGTKGDPNANIPVSGDPESPPQEQASGKDPDMSDILIAYPSYEGYASFRTPITGSFFIQTLVKVFREYADIEHIVEMLARVTDEVLIRAEDKQTGRTQVPSPTSTLRKKLYFRPRT